MDALNYNYVHIQSLLKLASGASPPSHVNGPIFLYIYIFICDGYCTYQNVIRASNFACALSSATMRSIQLVIVQKSGGGGGSDLGVSI